MVGGIGIGDVYADIIAAGEKLAERLGAYDLAREHPRRVHGHERVVAAHGHPQLQRHVGHQRAHRAETDDAKSLAQKLGTGEAGLALFHQRGYLAAPAGNAPDPLYTAEDVAGGQHHGAKLLLLDGLRVRAGAVEYDYAAFGALLHGDVVVARARAGDGQKLRRKLRAVQVRRADEQSVGTLCAGTHLAAAACERLDTLRGHAVHCLYPEHIFSFLFVYVCSFSNSRMYRASASTPSMGIAL